MIVFLVVVASKAVLLVVRFLPHICINFRYRWTPSRPEYNWYADDRTL